MPLDLDLSFGCVAHIGRALDTVGSIRISYNFKYYDRELYLDPARSGRSDPDACRAAHPAAAWGR